MNGGRMRFETSEDALKEAWRLRDERYADRLHPLTEAEVTAIRKGRKQEAGFVVPPARRGPVSSSVSWWNPPALGEVS